MLFLHGYLASKESFAYQKPFFKRDFNVFIPDLKGFGENADMQYPYALSDYVKEVEEYIDKNGLKKPHVIAHSFGGRIVLKLAAENKNAFDKIVLTGAAGLKPKRSVKYRLKRAAFNALKLFLPKSRLSAFYSADYNALSPVMKESFKKIVAEHLDYTLPLIKNRTLIIFGQNDRETPLYMAERLFDGIENSEKIIIKDAGHFAFIDKPLRFNTEVREFLLSR